MTTSHARDVCFSNRTMSPEEKERLLPKEVTRLYNERHHMMYWVLVKLEVRRIWKYVRGEKIYKEGETGALVERFQDIKFAWKMSGTDRMYNPLFHAIIGQFDLSPHFFFELSREYMDLPDVWLEFDETKLVLGQNKRDSSLKIIVTSQRAKLIDRLKHLGKHHNKRITVTFPNHVRENRTKWSRRMKGLPLPPLVRLHSNAAALAAQQVSNM
jgi:hypothetical protein